MAYYQWPIFLSFYLNRMFYILSSINELTNVFAVYVICGSTVAVVPILIFDINFPQMCKFGTAPRPLIAVVEIGSIITHYQAARANLNATINESSTHQWISWNEQEVQKPIWVQQMARHFSFRAIVTKHLTANTQATFYNGHWKSIKQSRLVHTEIFPRWCLYGVLAVGIQTNLRRAFVLN